MQKTNNRTPMNTAKVAKKAKKMGTPSPPKKKKSNEIKVGDTVTNAAATKTPKTKTPVKKIAVVAKKSNVGKKELKVAVKKKTPIKIPAQIKKIIKKPVAKKVKQPKITPEKSEKVDKPDKTEKPDKPEKTDKKVTTPKQSEKNTEKNEESEVVISKAKKIKKSEEESTKTTAKKQNSKLSKKSNDTEPAVKPLPSTIVHNEVVKDIVKNTVNKKSNEKIDKKSGLNSEKAEENIDEVKSKAPPKKKLVKVVKKIPVEKKIVKKVQKPINTEVIEEIDKNKKDDIVPKGESEKKPVKKEPILEVEKDKDKEKDKKQKLKEDEESDKDTKETIAKLLKEVNKTISKSPTKKKRETLNSKTSPNNSIIKKSKIIAKPKPKTQEILIKVKTESTDSKDETIQTPQKKVVKKLVAKPKKKVVIKTEEETEPKKEKVKIPEKDVEVKSKAADDEKNTNTDDSTTSDEITLNLLRQTQSSSPSQTQSQSEKKTDEPVKQKIKKKIKIKTENSSDTDRKSKPIKQIKKTVAKKIQQKKKMLLLKNKMRKITKERKRSTSTDTEQQKNRKLKLYSWWTGPKRHRVASLNALAKVHCLYENESRGALYDVIKRSPVAKESNSEGEPDNEMDGDTEPTVEPSTRTLRSVPGLRGVGKHWEMHDETSSSSCEEASNDSSVEAPKRKLLTPPPSYKQKEEKRKEAEKKPSDEKEKIIEKKKPVRKRRNRTELIMDLKDMVVRKRMASLNASAILAASYSVEKKPFRSPKSESSTETSESDESMVSDTIEKEYKRKCYDSDVSVKKEESSDRKVIEVRASPNKKVAVILNQDTDVTITGVYVNSTTRSTHHEGFCSIAGMQYRISATSHTQTAATAVATETLLHSSGEHGPPEQPCKSYTPLGALSNMQPPGSHPHAHPHGHGHPPHVVPPAAVSPSGRRHGCTSAFAAPPPTQYGPPHHHHHGPHPPPPPPLAADQQPPPAYIHGYYQPAGPLITAHHGHSHPPPAPAGKTAPLPTLEASPSPTPPPTTHQPPPSSTGTAESSDNEVIITSASSGSAEQVPVALPAAQTYRYATSSQYPPGTHAPPGYSYSYPPSQYYHSAPAGFAQQQHYHHDICYPGSAYPPSYLHPKAYTTTFRRYLPPPSGPQYYPANPELYTAPPSSGQSSQVVTASSGAGGSSYQAPPTGPPPPTLVESYAPPPAVPPTIVEPYPPPHYYTPSYGSGPAPPPCYSHSPPTRNLAFIEPAYQSCPCPMQSCPKNVHTGPLTGDGKRSNAIAKESMPLPLPLPLPLPPVALALPLEPASVAGPPSPARGSAGMPPPPSPAGATYQPTPTPTKWDTTETELDTKTSSPSAANTTRTKPRLGKTMVRNTILNSNSNINNNNNNITTTNNNNINMINTTAPHHPQGMLLMCHNQSNAQTQPQQADVKREVESPEEQKPTPETVVEIPTIQSNQTEPQSKTKAKTKTETETETESETEVQNNITDECSKRLSPEDVNQKLMKSEECDEVTLQNAPVRRKSNVHVDVELPPTIENETETIINHLEKTSTKRKLSIDQEEPATPVQTKKQKPNPKPNGSYKNLIKRNNNNKFIKINNGKRKLILESELKAVTTECKTPKIMLGKNKKTTKRKNNNNNNNNTTTITTKEEPVVKKAKSSKPLIERNLHTLKQNVRHKDKHQESIENKEPVVNVKKTVQRKNQVNSKSSTLNNVDRTIESVILNCVYVEETLRTSDSVLKQVVDKQNNNKQNCNNKQPNLADVIKTTDTTITLTTTATTTTTTTSTTKQNPNLTRVTHTKAAKIGCGRAGTTKRKSKDKPLLPLPLPVSRIPRRSFSLPKWSNGWSWKGDCFQGKVFINSDEPLVVRKCYPAMEHQEGDVISPRDCVLLKAGPRKIDLPFVAKVAALWEDDEGEMMMSLLWYYRPEHTEQGRRPVDQPDEVFASRHKDTNSVACIEDKCYVLTFNEYCRYRKNVRRIEEGMEQTEQIVPLPEGGQYYRELRQPPALSATAPDLVFFCRQVYDFRQKRIVKNPS